MRPASTFASTRRVEEPAVAVEAAREPLVGGRLERRALVEAEALRRVEDLLRAELQPDVAEDGVDRVRERAREVDRPERARRVEVVHALAVHRAVARIDERRLRRVLLGLERRRRRDDLEGRARHVEPCARTVDERRGGRAVRRDVGDLAVVLLDEVRVEARRGGHHEHLAGARVERHDRAAVRPERLVRDLLRIEVERRHDVVSPDGLAAQLVERLVEHGREVRVRGREVVVERALEPRSRSPDGRVADDVCRQRPVRVAAEEQRPAVDLALTVPCEPSPGLEREDEPAVDRELGDASDRVVLTRREARRRPCLPVRRHRDEDGHEPERDVRESDDLPVHRGVFARFDTSRRRASRMKFATMLVPP